MTATFTSDWRAAHLGVRRSLELAHMSFVAGGLPVGAVLLERDGRIAAEGRNRAYDPPGGDDPLQGNRLAHAETNALARMSTAADLSGMTLWSSHQPCIMCAAACEFTGVGTVCYVAPDPSDPEHARDPADADHRWLIAANLLFLGGVAAMVGPNASMVVAARVREPETAALVDAGDPKRLRTPTLDEALETVWSDILDAARRRQKRLGTAP